VKAEVEEGDSSLVKELLRIWARNKPSDITIGETAEEEKAFLFVLEREFTIENLELDEEKKSLKEELDEEIGDLRVMKLLKANKSLKKEPLKPLKKEKKK